MAKVIKLRKDNIDQAVSEAARALKNDQLAVLPSDTVYGLAANARSKTAVEKIFAFKGRRFGKAISIFLPNIETIKKYAFLNPHQESIIKTLLPGAFTVILKSKHKVVPEVEAEDGTVGIRVIDFPLIKSLAEKLPFPITATSANLSGQSPHLSVEILLKTLPAKKKEMLGLIVDSGKLPPATPSTVVRLIKEEIEILRPGVLNPQLINRFEAPEEEDTKKAAREIYRSILTKDLKQKAAVVILRGELGAGKTVFAKGIGELFGKELVSPTFVLVDEYEINRLPLKNLYHLDLYRIEDEEEIKALKLTDLLRKGNLLMIEWGEKLSVFGDLKARGGSFYWLQIEVKNGEKRELKLYRV